MAADSDNLRNAVLATTPGEISALRQAHDISGLCYLFVGQLIARKGVSELLTGWARFEQQSPGAGTLILVGDGAQREELQQKANQLGIRNVRFLGSVDYDSISRYYATADAVVMPTLEDNWSLVVPEAMACSKPILCSIYNGGWPELVEDGENGWTFDPRSAESVTQALQNISAGKNDLMLLGKRSHEIVQDFTPAKAAEAIFRACQMAVER